MEAAPQSLSAAGRWGSPPSGNYEMSQTDRERGGGISLTGLLLVLTGGGLLYSAVKFGWLPVLSRPWSCAAFVGLLCGLTMWAIRLIIAEYSDKRTDQKLRFSRHSATVPWQWVFYLAIMVVCFVGSLLGSSNMLMMVFAVMAGPFILNGWAAYSMLNRTSVRRKIPRRAAAGVPTAVEVAVENRKWLISSWLMTVDDQIQNGTERLEAGVLLARIPRRSTRSAHYQMRLMQRGKYTLGPLKLSTRFPLGLVERSRVFDQYDEILVHPRLGRISAAWKRDQLMAHELVHREDHRRGAFDDEFHGIREYRWGDNPRAIHWRTSARRNELMVREFHQSRDQNLVLLLELWQPQKPREIDLERVELAVSLAASICVEHMRRSGDSELSVLVDGAAPARWEGHSQPRNIESLLDMLALVQAGSAPDVRRLLDDAAAKRTLGTRTLLLTTRGRGPAQGPGAQSTEAGLRGRENGSDYGLIEVDERSLRNFFQLA
jgi:uncharacterized protein (DUF58 family)